MREFQRAGGLPVCSLCLQVDKYRSENANLRLHLQERRLDSAAAAASAAAALVTPPLSGAPRGIGEAGGVAWGPLRSPVQHAATAAAAWSTPVQRSARGDAGTPLASARGASVQLGAPLTSPGGAAGGGGAGGVETQVAAHQQLILQRQHTLLKQKQLLEAQMRQLQEQAALPTAQLSSMSRRPGDD